MNTNDSVSNDVVDNGGTGNVSNDAVTTTLAATTGDAVANASASAAATSAPVVKKSPGRPRSATGAAGICRKLYAENVGKPRSEMVKLFIAAGVKEDTANTYYHNVHNEAIGKVKTRKVVVSGQA